MTTETSLDAVIVGTGGFAIELFGLFQSVDKRVAGFVGLNPDAELPAPFLGADKVLAERLDGAVCFAAVGKPATRRLVVSRIKNAGCRLGIFIHPSAWVAENAKIGDGCLIYPNATVHANVRAGEAVVINSNATVGHETEIGDYCNIGPGVALGARMKVDEEVYLGIGSSYIEGLAIAANVVVGAGAAVVTDILEPGVYMGVPAKRREK